MTCQETKPLAIKVYVRQRPFTQVEIDEKTATAVYAIHPREIILKRKRDERRISFDHVFGPNASQSDVYNNIAAPMIHNVISGFNCTLFAYGQKETGKKYTIFGNLSGGMVEDFNKDNSSAGIVLRASKHLFSELSKLDVETEYTVRVSFVEIYNEEVLDLLKDYTPLRVYDDPLVRGSVCLKDLLQVTVFNTQDVLDWLNIGLHERQKSSVDTSRSHIIFTFFVDVKGFPSTDEEVMRSSKLQLVILSDSENAGVKAKFAKTINRASYAFVDVIKSLANKQKHVSYRQSKLTRIFQGSLGGNSQTAIIVTISPNIVVWDETIKNLELVHSARSITNVPQVNVIKKHLNLRQRLNEEINKLKADLEAVRGRKGHYVNAEEYQKMEDEVKSNKEKMLDLIRKIRDLKEHALNSDSQYHNLIHSFENTKKFLEEKKQQLQKLEQEVQLKNEHLNSLSEKHDLLHESASSLLNICNDSTKHEDLFYKKFQNKCNINMSNAEISKNMLLVSLNSMEIVQQTSHNNLQQTVDYSNNLKATSYYFSNQYTTDLNRIKELINNVQKSKDNLMLHLDEISKNKNVDYSLSAIKNSVDQIYRRHLDQMTDHIKFIECLETMETETFPFLEQKIAHTSAALEESIKFKQTLSSLERNLFSTISNHLAEKKIKLILEIEKDRAEAESVRRTIAAREEEKIEVDAESEFLKQLYIEISDLLNQNKQENLNDNVQFATEYSTSANKAYDSQRTKCNQILESNNQTQADINKNKHEIKNTHNHFAQFSRRIEEYLTQKNDLFYTSMYNWNTKLEDLQEVIANGVATTSRVELGLQQKHESQLAQMVEIESSIHSTVSALENLCSRIKNVGPEGNTPQKRTYNLPRKIVVRKDENDDKSDKVEKN